MAIKDEFVVANYCVELRQNGEKRYFKLFGANGAQDEAVPEPTGSLRFKYPEITPSFVRQQVERRWDEMLWNEMTPHERGHTLNN